MQLLRPFHPNKPNPNNYLEATTSNRPDDSLVLPMTMADVADPSLTTTPTRQMQQRSKSDLLAARISSTSPQVANQRTSNNINHTKRNGKKSLRPWRRFTGRFQQRRDDDDEEEESVAAASSQPDDMFHPMDTYVGSSVVNSLRSLSSTNPGDHYHPRQSNNRSDQSLAELDHPNNHDHYDLHDPDENGMVNQLERILRHVGVVALCYTIGAHLPQALPVVQKVAEYSIVAWVTCVGILWALKTNNSRAPRTERQRLSPFSTAQEQQQQQQRSLRKLPSADEYLLGGFAEERTPLLQNRSVAAATPVEPPNRGRLLSTSTAADEDSHSPSINGMPQPPLRKSHHPALEPFYVVNTNTGERVTANSGVPLHMETDYFAGTMVVLIRTPNLDDPDQPVGSPENIATCRYMKGKQRRFEFQFQLKLKKVPKGRLYFACELGETVKMGMVQRAFVSAAMAFVKTTNSSFHYSMTGNPVTPDGRYEKPHMAFPVEEGMNRVVSTSPGQPLPALGGEIVEDPESIKKRKKGVPIAWKAGDTYTLSLWSAYVDFLEWKCCNLPGIRPFGMTNVIGRQPIILTVYDIPENRSTDKHYRCDMIDIVRFEMSNTAACDPGDVTRKLISMERAAERSPRLPRVLNNAVNKSPGGLYELDEEDEELGGFEELPEQDDEDEDAAAELGEGIYVRSGDVIALRESVTIADVDGEDNDSAYHVTNGGGFAVLRGRHSSSIIIEKAARPRFRSKSAGSRLIKTGDTVVLKLVISGSSGEEKEMRYLSLHRGWWLKWVSAVPTKNGFFTIHTHEPMGGVLSGKDTVLSNGSENSYLTLGGSFFLRHRRWSKYLVGVAREGSATYGGRMLGLYNPRDRGNNSMGYQTEDDGLLDELPETDGKGDERWIRPLYLEVCDANSKEPGENVQPKAIIEEGEESKDQLFFSSEENHMDSPAWLEVMDRSKRLRQLVYVIRVVSPQDRQEEAGLVESKVQEMDPERSAGGQETFVRFRTGRDLSQVMRAGLSWRHSNTSSKRRRDSTDMISGSGNSTPVSSRHGGISSPSGEGASRHNSFDDAVYSEFNTTGDSDSSDDSFPGYLDEVDAQDIPAEGAEGQLDDTPSSKAQKGRKLIGKIARSVKEKTATTGKKVVRQSVKVGKGTVNAGKAIISGRPRQPPSKEPRSGKPRSRRSVERDLRVAVSNRTIKRVERGEMEDDDPASVTVGELSAPEQSCRTVSNMLSRMSSVPSASPVAAKFSQLLAAQVQTKSQFDISFLQGGSVELGVTPSKDVSDKRLWVYDCIVARCLWETHWREEWCGVQRRGVVFYAPLTKDPVLEISFKDIEGIRLINPGHRNPLPGFPILAIETAWSCHYMALANEEIRETLRAKLEESVQGYCASEAPNRSERETELWNARLWQGLQDSLESSLSSGRGKWADVHSSQRYKRRVVLNNRRMLFDTAVPSGDTASFVGDLLSTSLSFSLHSLQHHPEVLSEFLDSTCKLRGLRLQGLDKSDMATFCIFTNLYHCLLQHALLLTPNGPLQKRSCEDFMRTCCYEIGGDVFSLAELNCYIIRGNMPSSLQRSTLQRAPYVDAPRKSAPFRYFALLSTPIPMVHFVLNTGDISCPKAVPVLRPDTVEKQLSSQASDFLKLNLSVDVSKRMVTLPKVCDVYKNDFSGSDNSGHACLRYSLPFLPDDLVRKIQALLQEEHGVTIKYQTTADQYRTILVEKVEPSWPAPSPVGTA